MRIGNSINTYTGVKLYPLDPRKNEIRTEDIVNAFSLISQANVHGSQFYSVDQQSLKCAEEAKRRDYSNTIQLRCLLHDASEAYLSDTTPPVKTELTKYIKIEKK